jgi:uncharacterized damage-inducible protein DinB
MTGDLLREPGRSGAFGALMDEYVRAAEDFLRVAESFAEPRWSEERSSPDENTRSPRAICLHVVSAAHRYADYIRKRRGMEFVERFDLDPARLVAPRDVRGLLREAILWTEDCVHDLKDDATTSALTFQVRWGPTYDPEMLLEHAVCHLLRHRRQLERW